MTLVPRWELGHKPADSGNTQVHNNVGVVFWTFTPFLAFIYLPPVKAF